jgi:hypothetical protein
MCFSATASFTVAAVLVPVGAYSLYVTKQVGRRWLLLASFPIAFAIQQAIEGFVWLGINADAPSLVAITSRGFLFFSHLFWPTWVPLSVYFLEERRRNKSALLGLTIFGFMFGLSIALPALLKLDWLSVIVINGSLEYKTVILYDGLVSREVLRIVYAAIVLSAFLVSSERRVKMFGAVILASVIYAHYRYDYAFISVWCYSAAIASIYIAGMLTAISRSAVASRQC